MSIELRDLNELDPDLVQQSLDEVIARVREDNETLYLKQGPFFGVLAYYHATLATRHQMQVRDYLNARSLSVMNADPASAEPDLVDEASSNFRVARKTGSNAVGHVTVVMSDNISVVIGAESVFVANGLQFLTTQVFTAKREAAQVVTDGDRLLIQQADGNWAFTIDVTAELPGEEYMLKKDTVITPLIVPNRYVASYAAADFLDGLSPETNEQLLTKLQTGASAKTIGHRVNNLALLLDDDTFSRLVGLSIVGLGDPELTRDQPTIFPIKVGGRTDWYLRSQEEVFREGVNKAASLIEKRSDGTGIWQMSFDREEAAGVYEIAAIRPHGSTDDGSFEITEMIRSVDVTGDGFKPDVPSAEHAAFSSYQTLTIRFHDDQTVITNMGLLDTAEYECERVLMPLIAEAQAKVNDYGTRYTGADCLVKAPVPCFVALHITITKPSGTVDPDTTSIVAALVREINQIGFTGRLYASQVHDIIHGYLEPAMGVSALDLHGRLIYPDGAFRYVRGADALLIVADESRMVSPRTVQFFATAADIAITVESSVPLNL